MVGDEELAEEEGRMPAEQNTKICFQLGIVTTTDENDVIVALMLVLLWCFVMVLIEY